MLSAQDKNVVERAGLRRNLASRVALRSARDRLHRDENGQQPFLNALLERHGHTQRASRWLIAAVLLCVLGGAGVLWWLGLASGSTTKGSGVVLVLCALGFAIVYAANERVCARRDATGDREERSRCRKKVNAIQVCAGTVWGVVIVTTPSVIGSGDASLGTVSAIAFATTAMVLHLHLAINIRETFAFATFPIAFALLLRAGMTTTPAEIAVGVAGLWVLLVLMAVSHRLHDGVVQSLEAARAQRHAVLEASETRALSEEARRRAEEANLAKTRFLATMSHELRTPLNAILGFSEIMSNSMLGPLDERYLGYSRDIHNSGSHLLKLINDILDLSRVEAGKYDLNEEALSLGHIASEAVQMMGVKAEQKSIRLVLNAEPTLPPVWVDERAMRQVMLNLLSNAVKFTPRKGTVALTVGWTKGGGQYVSVRDNGPGIAEEELPHVMDTFGQGSIALRAAEPGTGLGLPIVKAFMEMHDGKFDLRSRLREGTEAIAIVPRRRVLADSLPVREARPRVFKAAG